MLRKSVLPGILMSFMLPVFAEPLAQKMDAQLNECQNRAQTTLDSAECYRLATKAWDGELNRQYLALLKESPASVRNALRASQRQWVKYRDTYNEAINTFYRQEQGTIWVIIAAESRMHVIRDKALDLYRLRESTHLDR